MIATVALFIALGGGAYAATQLPKNSVGSKQLKANAVTGPKIKNGAITAAKIDSASKAALSGPQGPKGDPGVPGAPGSALGYAHLIENKLDASKSKGVVAVKEGVFESGVTFDAGVICFDLAFTPSSVSVTPQAALTSSTHIASFWAGAVPANEPRASHAGCPAGYNDAEAEAFTAAGGVPNGIWVVFF